MRLSLATLSRGQEGRTVLGFELGGRLPTEAAGLSLRGGSTALGSCLWVREQREGPWAPRPTGRGESPPPVPPGVAGFSHAYETPGTASPFQEKTEVSFTSYDTARLLMKCS